MQDREFIKMLEKYLFYDRNFQWNWNRIHEKVSSCAWFAYKFLLKDSNRAFGIFPQEYYGRISQDCPLKKTLKV